MDNTTLNELEKRLGKNRVKKNFVLAAVFCALATATRFVGIFLVIPVLWYSRKIILLPLSLFGLLLYSTYLYIKFGDPLYFSTVESVWHRTFINPISTIYSYLTVNPFHKPFNDYLDLASTIGFLAALAAGIKKIPASWLLYSLLVILVPASTGTLTSMPRYVLSAFPVFILFGIYLKDKLVLKTITWGIFLVLQVALAIMFVNGYWTA